MERKSIEIIIEHFKTEKWFTDALKARDDARDKRTRRAAYIGARQAEFIGKSTRPAIEAALGKEFDDKEA